MQNKVWASQPFTVKFAGFWNLSFPIGTRLTWSAHAGCYTVSPSEALRTNPDLAESRALFLHECKNRYIFAPKDLPKRILVQYDVPEWAVNALINDDFQGLSEGECDMVRNFCTVNMIIECSTELEPEPFFTHHPAFGLPGTCLTLNCIAKEVC